MPGLILFKRKWAVASDDFSVPGVLCSCTRLLWLSLLVPCLVALFKVDCPESDRVLLLNVRNFVILAISLYSCTFCLYLAMLIVTLRGTLIEHAKRTQMRNIIRPLVPVIFLETVLTLYATALESNADVNTPHRLDPCDGKLDMAWVLLHVVVAGSWLDLSFTCCCGALAVAMSHSLDDDGDHDYEATAEAPVRRRRCYCFGTADAVDADDDDGGGGATTRDDGEGAEEDDVFAYNEYDEEAAIQPSTTVAREDANSVQWRTWFRQLCSLAQVLTCGLFGGINGTGGPDAFQEFATILSGFFKSLDLVPSDIVAALFLMRAEQRLQEKIAVESLIRERLNAGRRRSRLTHVGRWMWAGRGASERAESTLHAQMLRTSRDVVGDAEAISFLRHAQDMAPFMLGAFGWMLYGYMHGVGGYVTLCCRCCRPSAAAATAAAAGDDESALPFHVQGRDTCCDWNTTALLMNTQRKTSLVYASFTSYAGRAVPYVICVDHENKRVVLACRGTHSITDAITDVTMYPVPLGEYAHRWGFHDDVHADSFAHAGILKIANWMRQDIQEHKVLHHLFRLDVESPRVRSTDAPPVHEVDADDGFPRHRAFSLNTSELPDCQGYDLVLTGHGLGAGVCVVLGLFLRPVLPLLRVMAFSPPGCVFDWRLANQSAGWTRSLFVGKDYSTRMSWHSLFKLRGQILDTLRRAKVSKASAFTSALLGVSADKLLFAPTAVPDSSSAREFQKKIDELAAHKPTVLDQVRLYAPGKLMHLVKDETVNVRRCCGGKAHYAPVWVDDRSALDEILLSSRMVADHLPNFVVSTLREVVEEYCDPAAMAQQVSPRSGSMATPSSASAAAASAASMGAATSPAFTRRTVAGSGPLQHNYDDFF